VPAPREPSDAVSLDRSQLPDRPGPPSLAFTTFLNITFDVILESDGGPLSITYRIFQLDGFLLIASSLYQRPT